MTPAAADEATLAYLDPWLNQPHGAYLDVQAAIRRAEVEA